MGESLDENFKKESNIAYIRFFEVYTEAEWVKKLDDTVICYC